VEKIQTIHAHHTKRHERSPSFVLFRVLSWIVLFSRRIGQLIFSFAAAGVEHRFENFSNDLAILGFVLWT